MKKRNLALIISAVVLCLIAIIAVIIIYSVNGEIIKFLQSKWAIIFLVAIIVYLLIVGIVLVKDKVNKL